MPTSDTRTVVASGSETLAALMAPAIPSRHGFFDECFRGPMKFSLGFMKPSDSFRFGSDDRAFGAPGAGGSLGYADPSLGIGYGYVTSQIGMHLEGDPRDIALRQAIPVHARRSSGPPQRTEPVTPNVDVARN